MNYGAETGFRNSADIFARTSTMVSLIVLAVVVGGFFLIRNNYKAFQLNNVIIIAGFVLAAGATVLYHLPHDLPGHLDRCCFFGSVPGLCAV